MSRNLHVAIVGATGAVGIEMMKTLEKRNFPVGQTDAARLARARREDAAVQGRGGAGAGTHGGLVCRRRCRALQRGRRRSPRNSRRIATQAGAVVVDNSSAFRMDAGRAARGAGDQWRGHQEAPAASSPIRTAPRRSRSWRCIRCTWSFGVKRVIASSYQAVSGTGAQAIEELRAQVEAHRRRAAGREESLSAPDRLQRPAARR